MSHHLAQDVQQQQQFTSQDSPTIGRPQVQFPSNNSSPASESGKRSRKAAPSPLQTSTTAISPPTSATPTRTTFIRTGGDQSVSSNDLPQQPRSPKERLDDLLASEKSFYRSEGESSPDRESFDESRSSFLLNMLTVNSRYSSPLHNPNAPSRSVSDPVLIPNSPGGSPSSTRPPIAATAPQHRIDMARAPPRTSSIDSAISSLSGGHSHKGSQDQNGAGSPDIAHLIHAAGSPEAVIQYLLKEKQSQTAQNTQLWRLVDKQRAMILGLNKDLERALKDKERYRKKLKDSLGQISNPSPVDSNNGISSDAGSTTSDPPGAVKTSKPSRVETLVSAGLRNTPEQEDSQHSPIDVALAPYPITPPSVQHQVNLPVLSNMVEAEHRMPSPTQHAFQQYNPDAPVAGFEAGQQQRKQTDIAREVPYNASLPPSRSLPSNPPKGPPPNAPPPRAPISSQTPSLALIEPSPNPDEGLRMFPAPPRKAPPAPLNLGKQNNPSSHLRQASGADDDSDSDYDDILEVDDIPAFPERGRRKTREEDDREREIAAMKEAEIRSLSKKSAQGSVKSAPKSKPATPKEGAFLVSADPMPISPRQTVPISPPDARSRHLSPSESNTGSLAGMLSEVSGVMSPPLMSPGLPLSPRPMDRGMSSPLPRNPSNHSSMASPPLSPRGMGAFPGAVPLSPRAPRQPIPLPPNTPISIASPGHPKSEPLQLVSPKPLTIAKKEAASDGSQNEEINTSPSIFRGLVTEEFPDLLLPPNALPSIDVKVASSRLKPSRSSLMFPKNFEEDPVFTLAVFSRSNGQELWRVEKDSASLGRLDQSLKQSSAFTVQTPEKSLFSGHSPAKVDARRAALDKYCDDILNTPMDTESALQICKYLSTNTVSTHSEDTSPDSATESPVKTGPGGRPLKNGYLTKRGKNFGGWKARFFVLDGPVFKYYESPGGPHLGTIKLQNAQIGKQQQHPDNQSPSRGDVDDVENQYRHAFLILEPKRKDSSSLVRHVLCAESDLERDQWVEALLQYVDYKDSEDEEHPPRDHARTSSGGSNHISGKKSKKKMYAPDRSQTLPELNDDSLRGISYENTKQGSIPHGVKSKNSQTPSPPTHGHERDPMSQVPQSKSISAPKNAQVIQDAGLWGNKQNMLAPSAADEKKQRKRSFFGFGSKPRVSTDSQEANGDSPTNLSQMAFEQHGPIRPVFGSPLGEAVRYNHPADVNIELPAVVYRCIEYLDAKNAAGEEGIFRLSGSNVVIKQLRERFNTEGDLNLITDDQYYDIHAVASLLKLYLRELPTTILTRELHLEFLAVTELYDVNEKISALNGLVFRLPRANNALLRYLSGFLINIINHSDTNKMTVRNVGIVFSPTLNIPAPVFALFLQQYEGIFGEDPSNHAGSPVEVTVSAPPLTPEDIRSPRRQKFQDLPTPSYDQQSFPQPQQAPPSFPSSNAKQYTSQQQQSGYDTGFTPLQPSYEPQLQQLSSFPTMAGPEYGRNTPPTLAGPAYDQFGGGMEAHRQYQTQGAQSSQGTKTKRRESSMFGMGNVLGQRKPSSNSTNQNQNGRLVEDESFFE
ncbi:putative Rho-type GTPase-activating protein [Lachnellula hyalina]|uniref:Putative Rho-type GTPase-activating protein n=1 Tax=Lachnellula hyalina TaxID=1316788 RepID=A0A8H8R7B2_9HELO|nr:putative Rho-type GTPase-activating protein [Lachnellula hyalina]TVY28926.1 putative Rho-type GTPase-activating protein [Lachnellula hyalina]